MLHAKHRHIVRATLRFLAYGVAGFLVAFAFWIGDNFGEPPLEQVLYHLQFGAEGLLDTDVALVQSFTQICIFLPLAIAAILTLMEWGLARYLTFFHANRSQPLFQRSFGMVVCKSLYWSISHRAPVYFMLGGFIYFCMQFSVFAFIHQQFGQDYFAKHYLNPRKVEIRRHLPAKNLMIIYVESLEASYQNKRVFGRDLIAPLSSLGGVSFHRFLQAPGTGWTIAGITASQCGLPLKSLSLHDSNGTGEIIKTFLPNAICLGDILHHFGYINVYMGGDALSFSGKGKFFQQHHFDEVYGREELKGHLTKAQMNYWGLYDDTLFEHVKVKLMELNQQKKPFNLVVTTIDTHGPDGHISQYCRERGVKVFDQIISCSAFQVKELIDWMRQKGYLKTTQVVILGDHLAMENPLREKLDKLGFRTIYNQFITEPTIHKTREQILHFDLFPTLLESLGFTISGGRLGLGYSASEHALQPPPQMLEEMNNDLLNDSETYLDLWKQDEYPSDRINKISK